MTNDAPAHFGIMTPPMQVDYRDLAQVWREADTIPQIEHAYLFDHLMPIAGDPNGPAFEGWTLLSALAAQTQRLRIGLLVTSNRFRPPAMLAKIAATVDVVSSGRLDFGIGAGSRPSAPIARREYEAHGLPFHDAAHAVGALGEALTVITRLWSADEPFDFDGDYVHLTNAFGNPKSVQQPHPPIVIGGGATPTLRVVARHADVATRDQAPDTERGAAGEDRAHDYRRITDADRATAKSDNAPTGGTVISQGMTNDRLAHSRTAPLNAAPCAPPSWGRWPMRKPSKPKWPPIAARPPLRPRPWSTADRGGHRPPGRPDPATSRARSRQQAGR